ncbi:MAG: aspartate aminotransferase family protein [Phycisphaerae bacterium]|nr:aspartate aminotransferase family protein [Phycisphaerae bacterium]
MSSSDFRTQAHRAIDFIADYLDTIESRPVLSSIKPGDIYNALPAHAPDQPAALRSSVPAEWSSIFQDLEQTILPGLTHWQSPNFFAFFPSDTSYPSILGELISAGLGVQGMLWLTSPACTELETKVLDWLGELIGLPTEFLSDGAQRTPRASVGPKMHSSTPHARNGGGVIEGTASDATLVALCAARHRVRTQHDRTQASSSPRFAIYTSTQAHSSVIKAAMIAGLANSPEDRTHIRLIDTDTNFALDPAALERAIREDIANGFTPMYVVATVGTTSSTAIDSIEQIAAVLDRTGCTHSESGFGTWLHIDAAHAGAACVCPEYRSMLTGIERADSIAFNPHKWLLTNFDCNCFFTRDRRSLTGALSITPEYLRNSGTDSGAIDYRDWQIPLGRRFRALKLWFVLRNYGAEGLRSYIREHMRLSELFESLVRADDRFEIVAPRTMNLICFRYRGDDTANKRLLDTLNASGKLYLTHTVLPGVGYTIRFCIGATATQERHVRDAWMLIQDATRAFEIKTV